MRDDLEIPAFLRRDLPMTNGLTETGATFPETLTFEEWQSVGQTLQRAERAANGRPNSVMQPKTSGRSTPALHGIRTLIARGLVACSTWLVLLALWTAPWITRTRGDR